MSDWVTPEMSIIHKVVHIVKYLSFVVLLTAASSIFLLLAWITDTDSSSFLSRTHQLAEYLNLQHIWPVLSFFGLSGGAIVAGLYWLYQKAFWKIVLPYLFSGLPKENK